LYHKHKRSQSTPNLYSYFVGAAAAATLVSGLYVVRDISSSLDPIPSIAMTGIATVSTVVLAKLAFG
jgi:hypothetical protein